MPRGWLRGVTREVAHAASEAANALPMPRLQHAHPSAETGPAVDFVCATCREITSRRPANGTRRSASSATRRSPSKHVTMRARVEAASPGTYSLQRSTYPGLMAYGWAGTAAEFLALNSSAGAHALGERHRANYGDSASREQRLAWSNELQWLAASLHVVSESNGAWGGSDTTPFEGGRRPDVVLLARDVVIVLEFKERTE